MSIASFRGFAAIAHLSIEPSGQLAEHAYGCVQVRVLQPVRKSVHPHGLSAVQGLVLRFAELGQANKLGASMVGVRRKLDQSVGSEAIDGRMDALAGQPHSARDLGHRQRPAGELNRPKHLPSRRRQPLVGGNEIPSGEKEAIGAKRREDDFGGSLPDLCPTGLPHDVSTLTESQGYVKSSALGLREPQNRAIDAGVAGLEQVTGERSPLTVTALAAQLWRLGG
jgi:hypothetical protein